MKSLLFSNHLLCWVVVMCGCGSLFSGSRCLAAVPSAPTDCVAIPEYAGSRAITVKWSDTSADEMRFEIERSTNGTIWSQVGQVGPGFEWWKDTNATDKTKTYQYKVSAVNDDGWSAASNSFGTSVAAKWPLVNGSHEMRTGFGDAATGNFWKFHEGIDVLANGHGGQDVRVFRGGVVEENWGEHGGSLAVKVDVGGGKFEYDYYLHISNRTPAKGAVLPTGQTIAKISTTAYADNWRHLHLTTMNAWHGSSATAGVKEDGTTLMNPFLRFDSAGDRDPLTKKPLLKDNNGDGKTFLFRNQATGAEINYNPKTSPLKNKVDIMVEAFDQMTTQLGYDQTPYQVGYWIDALDAGGKDVRSAASPYVLVEFDDNFFPDASLGTAAAKTNLLSTIYDTNKPATTPAHNGTAYPFGNVYNHFTVTNTDTTTGRVAGMKKDQHWNTKAKDDGQAATVAHANYAGKPMAANNGQARFKDGKYRIHSMLWDVRGASSLSDETFNVVVDNFNKVKTGKKNSPINEASVFVPGDEIYLTDLDEYENSIMNVYLIDRGLTGGSLFEIEDDLSYSGMPLVQILGNELIAQELHLGAADYWLFDSDLGLDYDDLSNPWPLIWSDIDLNWAYHDFYVAIDYDMDGLFTIGLDPLSEFTVVPEPATLLTFFVAFNLILRGRRYLTA